MSRIGNKPIPLPKGVEVKQDGNAITVKGPKGSLVTPIVAGIGVKVEKNVVSFTRTENEGKTRALHGLMRALVANNVTGVTEGFKKELDIVGVGYKAAVEGKKLVLSLGFSHPVNYAIPEGIKIAVDAKANRMTIAGIDRQQVGQVAAEIRHLRRPDPYKQKGIRYVGERLKKKAGKAGATGTGAK